MRGLLLRLVTPSATAARSTVASPCAPWASTAAAIASWATSVRARLLTADDGTVEIAHESLVRAWPRLRTWLDDDAAGVRILRHLSAAANGWDALGRPDGELYRGARLEVALEWRTSTSPT